MVLTKHLSEPWFSFVKSGRKTIEGRLAKPPFNDVIPETRIKWVSDSNDHCITKVVRTTMYSSFLEYLQSEGLGKCLPDVSDCDKGETIYRQFYSEADELKFGVVALELEAASVK